MIVLFVLLFGVHPTRNWGHSQRQREIEGWGWRRAGLALTGPPAPAFQMLTIAPDNLQLRVFVFDVVNHADLVHRVTLRRILGDGGRERNHY